MSILLCVSIAWVTLCVLLVGLDLICLLIVEHASDTSQAMGADEGISDQARQMAKLDLAMDGPFGGKRVSSPMLVTRSPNWGTRLP